MISWLEATLFPFTFTSAATIQFAGIPFGTSEAVESYTANEGGATRANSVTTFVSLNSHNVLTSTTITYEEEITTTQPTSTSFSALTTRSTTTSQGAASATTWKTQTTSIESTTPTEAYTTREQTQFGVTVLEETVLANAFNTVYLAQPNEVLYVAGSVPLSSSASIGQTMPTATKTTLSAAVITVSVVVIGPDAEQMTATNQSFSSVISWVNTVSAETTTQTATIGLLPHSTTTTETSIAETTTTSQSYSRASESIAHYGDTIAVESSFIEAKTLLRYVGQTSFNEIYTGASVFTKTLRHNGVFLSSTNSATLLTTNSETLTLTTVEVGGGQTTLSSSALYLGVKTPPAAPQWSVYGMVGAAAGQTTGLAYAMTQNLSFVSTAKVGRSADGLVTILPATNGTYTANHTGISWTTLEGTNNTTLSTEIAVTESPYSAFFLQNFRTGLIGGNVNSQETAAQRMARGLYQDAFGNTSFFEGNDTTYDSADTVATSYYKPKYWIGETGPPITAVPRNSAALDFIPV